MTFFWLFKQCLQKSLMDNVFADVSMWHSMCSNPQNATCLADLKNYPKNATVQFFGYAPFS